MANADPQVIIDRATNYIERLKRELETATNLAVERGRDYGKLQQENKRLREAMQGAQLELLQQKRLNTSATAAQEILQEALLQGAL